MFRHSILLLAMSGSLLGPASAEPEPANRVVSALPDVEPLTLDSLMGDWGLYDRNQQRSAGAQRSCAAWDHEVLWLDFDGGRVPLFGEFKLITAHDGTLWHLTAYTQQTVSEIDNPDGDRATIMAGDQRLVLLRSDLHISRDGMAKRRVEPDEANRLARGGYPIEFFEFRIWDAARHPGGAMPESAGRALKCIPGQTL